MRKFYYISSVIVLMLFAALLPSPGLATTAFESATKSISDTSKAAELQGTLGANPSTFIQRIIPIVIGMLGVAAVILVIYAGGLWLTAAGSEEKVTKAKKILRSTIVGIIIVGLAYAITSFVISQVVGSPTAPSTGQPALQSSVQPQ